ncbi:MAG TPA: GreA/GreB family elongation factor [Geobacteraceae bacterium]
MTNLITAEGRAKLQERYDFLWEKERPRIVKNMAEAAAEGDRSENAEYIYSKKRLREIDRELKHLGSRLKVLKVAYAPLNPITVSFGCWVTYEDEEGEVRCYQLVGPDEFDVASGRISIDSPVGHALLNRKVDDEVTIRRPAGELTVTIIDISSKRPTKN